MIRRALTVAIALAAVASPAHAMHLTWTDPAGDANVVGAPAGSQRAFDVVGARVGPYGMGIAVQIDLLGAPSDLPGHAVWFTARQGGCTVLAQWSVTAVPTQARAVTACLDAQPYTTDVVAFVQEHAVEIDIPDSAFPGTPRHVTLHDIAVGTSPADPVTGVAQVEASIDVSCYHGVYVPEALGRTGPDSDELPSICDARSSVR